MITAEVNRQAPEDTTRVQFKHAYPRYLRHLLRIIEHAQKLSGPIDTQAVTKGQPVSKLTDVLMISHRTFDTILARLA